MIGDLMINITHVAEHEDEIAHGIYRLVKYICNREFLEAYGAFAEIMLSNSRKAFLNKSFLFPFIWVIIWPQ